MLQIILHASSAFSKHISLSSTDAALQLQLNWKVKGEMFLQKVCVMLHLKYLVHFYNLRLDLSELRQIYHPLSFHSRKFHVGSTKNLSYQWAYLLPYSILKCLENIHQPPLRHYTVE